MKTSGWGRTDVGLKREINQDTILVDNSLGLYIVADGMGGHKGGEVASAIAVSTAKEIVSEGLHKNLSPRDLLIKAYREASERIHYKSTVENPQLAGMGTTMVLGLVVGTDIYIGNVGDSRCYLYKNQHIWQMTEDHSLVNEQLRAGVISEDEVDMMVGKNVITRSVGYEKDVRVDIFQKKIETGEKVLLCSDGLSGLVSDAIIEDICRKRSGQNCVDECIEKANEAGGDDNISVILIQSE
ncbi:MAG: Stp1/IreP family PP2C-type Ser/Thr phosphatase [Bdellovibrionales bacterium]|nr:Stp1/IreP family PP2C-type Ser/Thr phosphatase [Bdellovibrionales bacterium]